MIASLTGRVARIDLDSLVLSVGGVGYLVRTTPQALSSATHGAELTLYTELVVREDSMTLYGFPHPEETDTFRVVQSVSGIGPRTALAVLTVLEPEELRRAIAEQDANTITRTPGIGPKVASRMILELSGKLPAPLDESASSARTERPQSGSGVDGQVVEALVGLGWPEKSAQRAVDEVAQQAEGEHGSVPDAAQILRDALRRLGGGR